MQNNNIPTPPQKSKRERILSVIYIVIAIALILATLSTAIRVKAATIILSCKECGGTHGDITYSQSTAGGHIVNLYCPVCFEYTTITESCTYDAGKLVSNGIMTHDVVYTCVYCEKQEYRTESHSSSYLRYEKINGSTHKVYRICLCRAEFESAEESHNFTDTTYTLLDNDVHVRKTSCICGEYTTIPQSHDLEWLRLTATDSEFHYADYKCIACKEIINLAEKHDNKYYKVACSICDYKNPTDFKMDINIKTSMYSNTNFAAKTNDKYIIDNEVELGDDGILTISGWIAINGGTKQFNIQYITADGKDYTLPITNLQASDKLTDSIKNNIANSKLDITDYDNGAYFKLNIDLSHLKNQRFILAVYVDSNRGQNELICLLGDMRHGDPAVTPPTEETTQPGEDETETVPPVVTPPSVDINTPQLEQAYNKGYQDAIAQLQHGVFGDVKADVMFFMYSKELDTTLTEHKYINLIALDNGIDFSQIYKDWKTEYGTNDFTLYYIDVLIEFPAGFIWSNDLLYFSGGSQITYNDLPINLLVYTVDENETTHEVTYKSHYDRYFWNIAEGEQYARTQAIQFRIDDSRLSFENLLVTQNLTLYANGIQYSTDISSYQQGKTDGYDKGWNDAAANIDNIVNTNSYTDGYNKGLKAGYNQGYHAGELIGRSDGLKENWNWYDMILSIPDAHLEVINGLFDITIFGVNMMTFVLSIVTLIVLWKVKKFLL